MFSTAGPAQPHWSGVKDKPGNVTDTDVTMESEPTGITVFPAVFVDT